MILYIGKDNGHEAADDNAKITSAKGSHEGKEERK